MDKNGLLENLTQELRRGTLVMIVLLNLKNQEYGYSLISKLQETGVTIEQNTLYPLLRRLEGQGLLISSWDTSESRPRKYYQISPTGEEILSAMLTEWKQINHQVQEML